MKDKLQTLLSALDDMERTAQKRTPLHVVDARAKIIVVTVFLIVMLSVPLSQLTQILLYALFPIVSAAMGGMGYGKLLRLSSVVIPFVAMIGIFNIFYQRTPVFFIGTTAVTEGWVSFLSIILRGLLSVQALLILIRTTGYYAICRALQRLGLPSIFTTQLLFVFRYMRVLIEQSLNMRRARDARSFGRSRYTLAVWGRLVGQLLIRTFERAEIIDRAMNSRGFTGRIPVTDLAAKQQWSLRDTLFLALWCAVLIAMRMTNPAERFSALLNM